jgi:hypothetical protein
LKKEGLLLVQKPAANKRVQERRTIRMKGAVCGSICAFTAKMKIHPEIYFKPSPFSIQHSSRKLRSCLHEIQNRSKLYGATVSTKQRANKRKRLPGFHRGFQQQFSSSGRI